MHEARHSGGALGSDLTPSAESAALFALLSEKESVHRDKPAVSMGEGDGNPGTHGGCSGNCDYPAYDLGNHMLIGTTIPHPNQMPTGSFVEPSYIGALRTKTSLPWKQVMSLAKEALQGAKAGKGNEENNFGSLVTQVHAMMSSAQATASAAAATADAASSGGDAASDKTDKAAAGGDDGGDKAESSGADAGADKGPETV